MLEFERKKSPKGFEDIKIESPNGKSSVTLSEAVESCTDIQIRTIRVFPLDILASEDEVDLLSKEKGLAEHVRQGIMLIMKPLENKAGEPYLVVTAYSQAELHLSQRILEILCNN